VTLLQTILGRHYKKYYFRLQRDVVKRLSKVINARFHQPTSQPNERSTVSIARFSVVELLLNPDRIAEVML